MSELINWLLQDDNPAVKYRTQKELLHQTGDKASVTSWIFKKVPENWYQTNGLWYRYYITAFAECGLGQEDIPPEKLEKAFIGLDSDFEYGCSDFMLLTALIKMGFSNHRTIQNIIDSLNGSILPDGGFLCQHRMEKLKRIPKSCYKADLHALMFFAECHIKGIDIGCTQPLIDYFIKRNVFYKSNDKNLLVLNCREGWRTIDTFYPFEAMRVGLQNVVNAFCSLGYGDDECLQEAWSLLSGCKDSTGKVILNGTLTKSYLPKEKVGKPSKWVTLYTLLAEQERIKS